MVNGSYNFVFRCICWIKEQTVGIIFETRGPINLVSETDKEVSKGKVLVKDDEWIFTIISYLYM